MTRVWNLVQDLNHAGRLSMLFRSTFGPYSASFPELPFIAADSCQSRIVVAGLGYGGYFQNLKALSYVSLILFACIWIILLSFASFQS